MQCSSTRADAYGMADRRKRRFSKTSDRRGRRFSDFQQTGDRIPEAVPARGKTVHRGTAIRYPQNAKAPRNQVLHPSEPGPVNGVVRKTDRGWREHPPVAGARG